MDYANAESEVSRAQSIVTYLDSILDRKYDISRNLTQLYRFFNLQMIRVVAGRNAELIDELIPLVEDLKDTFKQADVLSKQRGKQS
jgi:flagellar protein FliS